MSGFFKVANQSGLNVALNYDKANLAVQLVNEYNSDILRNVSTIVPLSGSAYGVYMNSENSKNIPEDMRMVFRSSMNDQQINMTPKATLIEYFKRFEGRPGMENYNFNQLENSIDINDTIHVNVEKIKSSIASEYYQVLEVASTIIHEATHANQMEEFGDDGEGVPESEENKFKTAVFNHTVGASLLADLEDIEENGNQIRDTL
jgi:hypothetical protein